MKLQLHATPEEVMRAVEALQGFARDLGLDETGVFGVALALEEAGSNIVNHALRRDPARQFQVCFEHRGGDLAIELRDDGMPFDPTLPRPERPAQEDQVGGWGIQLIRRHVDEVVYQRIEAQNVLCLRKRLTGRNADK